jgi:hypothetical protein
MHIHTKTVRVTVNCHFCNSTNVSVTDDGSDREPVT